VNLGLRVTWVTPVLKALREIMALLVHKVLPVLLVLLVRKELKAQPELLDQLVPLVRRVRRVKLEPLYITPLVRRVVAVDSKALFQVTPERLLLDGLGLVYHQLTTTYQLGRNPKTRAPQKGALFVFSNLIDYI
jgi:hypothetical protein